MGGILPTLSVFSVARCTFGLVFSLSLLLWKAVASVLSATDVLWALVVVVVVCSCVFFLAKE